jgi:hypothetical protein
MIRTACHSFCCLVLLAWSVPAASLHTIENSDTLRTATIKMNSNFVALAAGGVGGSTNVAVLSAGVLVLSNGISLTAVTTNSGGAAVWTNAPGTNLTVNYRAVVVAGGSTNGASWLLDSTYRLIAGGGGASWSNNVLNGRTASGLAAWFTNESGAIKLLINGQAGEAMAWHIEGLWTATTNGGALAGGSPPPSGTNALTPSISPAGGLAGTNATITSAGPALVNVYWTTNGTDPTTNLTAWKSPATVTNIGAVTLKALAWTNDGNTLPSAIASATFTNASTSYSLVASNVDTTSHDYRTLGNSAGNQLLATKFTAPETATLTRIDLLLGKVGIVGSPTGQLTLRLMGSTATDATAVPTNILATATATVDATSLSTLGTSNWVQFAFSGAPVTNAAVYWIAMETTQAASVLDYVGWWAPNVFCNACAYNSTNGVLWTSVIANQLNFRAWK